jgi:hypothetical protein
VCWLAPLGVGGAVGGMSYGNDCISTLAFQGPGLVAIALPPVTPENILNEIFTTFAKKKSHECD